MSDTGSMQVRALDAGLLAIARHTSQSEADRVSYRRKDALHTFTRRRRCGITPHRMTISVRLAHCSQLTCICRGPRHGKCAQTEAQTSKKPARL